MNMWNERYRIGDLVPIENRDVFLPQEPELPMPGLVINEESQPLSPSRCPHGNLRTTMCLCEKHIYEYQQYIERQHLAKSTSKKDEVDDPMPDTYPRQVFYRAAYHPRYEEIPVTELYPNKFGVEMMKRIFKNKWKLVLNEY